MVSSSMLGFTLPLQTYIRTRYVCIPATAVCSCIGGLPYSLYNWLRFYDQWKARPLLQDCASISIPRGSTVLIVLNGKLLSWVVKDNLQFLCTFDKVWNGTHILSAGMSPGDCKSHKPISSPQPSSSNKWTNYHGHH